MQGNFRLDWGEHGVRQPVSSVLWDHTVQHDMDEGGIICRHVHTPDSYASIRHQHTGIGIVYCVYGKGTFALGDQILPYSTGSLVYFDSEVPHHVSMETSYERWDLCVRPEVAAGLLRNDLFRDIAERFLPGRLGNRLFHIPESERFRLDHLFQELYYESEHRRPGFELYVQCKLIELFILFQRLSSTPVIADSRRLTPTRISEILAYIDEQLPHNPSVEAIARTFHYSPSQFYRIMRSATGKTPSQYIRSRKMDRARQLLMGSRLTVSAISRAVGMSSVPYFCKTFRDETGCTPQEFRMKSRRATTGEDGP